MFKHSDTSNASVLTRLTTQECLFLSFTGSWLTKIIYYIVATVSYSQSDCRYTTQNKYTRRRPKQTDVVLLWNEQCSWWCNLFSWVQRSETDQLMRRDLLRPKRPVAKQATQTMKSNETLCASLRITCCLSSFRYVKSILQVGVRTMHIRKVA